MERFSICQCTPSTATLPGADNRMVRGVAHVALAFDSRVISASMRLFDSPPM
jgi:triacylglycerol lipase